MAGSSERRARFRQRIAVAIRVDAILVHTPTWPVREFRVNNSPPFNVFIGIAASVGTAMLSRFSSLAARRPMLVGAATATVKTCSADVLVQTTLEGRRFDQLDTKRTAVFTIFGGCWMGFGQYLLYCRLFEYWVPGTTALASASKAALDQLVHVPLLYFPIFYSIDALLEGQWARGADAGLAHMRTKMSEEMWPSLKANWTLWLPASFIGFKLVPTHLRIPYVSAVSMIWTTILSMMQGRFRAAKAAAGDGAR